MSYEENLRERYFSYNPDEDLQNKGKAIADEVLKACGDDPKKIPEWVMKQRLYTLKEESSKR